MITIVCIMDNAACRSSYLHEAHCFLVIQINYISALIHVINYVNKMAFIGIIIVIVIILYSLSIG